MLNEVGLPAGPLGENPSKNFGARLSSLSVSGSHPSKRYYLVACYWVLILNKKLIMGYQVPCKWNLSFIHSMRYLCIRHYSNYLGWVMEQSK